MPKERKEKIAKVLIPELMTSKYEDEYSDGEKNFVVKLLPWLSEKLFQIKNNLDETYYAEIETNKYFLISLSEQARSWSKTRFCNSIFFLTIM